MVGMLIFIFFKALLVQLIDSKTRSSTNGNGVTLFYCIGCSVVIKCALNKIKSDPVWSRNGKSIITHGDRRHSAKENKLNLQISDLVTSDTAKYCCLAITERNISEEYCTLLEIIELQILPSKTIVGTNGSTINVTCSLKKNIPGAKTISLIRNGKVVSTNNSNIITVTFLLNTEINEQIKCRADIDCIDIPLEQDVTINVTYRPQVKVMALPSPTLYETDNVSLTCTYESNPYPRSVTWTKNSKNVSHDDTYKILNLSRLDNGVYTCNVFNSIGNGVAKVHIRVLYAPEVVVEKLQNGSLLCNATGVPNTYTFPEWEHRSSNGYLLRKLDSEGSGLLSIHSQNDDDPIYTVDGRYHCKASNGITDKNNMTMQSGFKDIYFPGKPHCFSDKEDRKFVNSSDSVMLTFDVYGLNITHFDWFSGIHNLTQSLEYEFKTEPSITSVSIYGMSVSLNTTRNTLKISNLTESHFDTRYTLFIYNEYGNASCSMKLLEGRVPAKPEKFKVYALIGGFQVSWRPGNSGYFCQHFIITYWSLLDQNWTTVEHLSHEGHLTVVQGLFENVEYIVYMYARNDIGKSDTTDNVTIQTLGSNVMSTRQSYSVTLPVYIAVCFCCVVILLLSSAFYIRLRDFALKGQMKTQTENSKQKTYFQQRHVAVYEEVILNPAQNGKRFIIRTVTVDDDANTSG